MRSPIRIESWPSSSKTFGVYTFPVIWTNGRVSRTLSVRLAGREVAIYREKGRR